MSIEVECKDIPDYIKDAVRKSTDREKTIADLEHAAKRARELTELRMNALRKNNQYVLTHPNGPAAGLDGILTNDTYAKAANMNADYTQKALQGYTEMFIPTVKENLSTTMAGLKRDKELGRAFVRAVIDGTSDNPLAMKMAKEWAEASEFMRERFNKFGGDVGRIRKGGYLPQSHDAKAIRNTPKKEWVNFIRNLLDDETLEQVDLDYVYDTISTGGLNKLSITEAGGLKGGGRGKSTAKKHADQRQLFFKDGESWIKYQEKFGNPDPMSVIDDHIRTMTTDMAMVEIFGPNPQNMFDTLKDIVIRERTLKGDKDPSRGLDMTEMMFNVVSGKVDRDEGKMMIAPLLQTTRAMNTASLLTSATLSTITDIPSFMINAGYLKMNPGTTLANFFKNLLNGYKKAPFQEQQMMGLGADVFSSEITRRFSELGNGFWAKASEVVMRSTMMNILTESSRMAFKTQYFHKLLNGRKITDLTPDEHIKILAEVNEQADYAVIMGNARSRAITTGGRAKGTISGELSRTATQFMTFPITFMQQHGARVFRQGNMSSRIAYGSALFTLATLGGSIAMISKDTAKGYDLRDGMNPFSDEYDTKTKLKFWGAAAAQGGGLGFLGDLFFSDQTRFGNSVAPSTLGPTAGLVEDFTKLTIGNLQELGNPDVESTHFGSELVEFIDIHANPTKVFYLKALQEKYITRSLKIMLDEDYERAEAQKQRKREREYGQEKFEWLQD